MRWRWVVNFTPWPLYSRHPLNRLDGLRRFWKREKYPLPGIETGVFLPIGTVTNAHPCSPCNEWKVGKFLWYTGVYSSVTCTFVSHFQTHKLTQAITCLTYIQVVSGSNLGSNITIRRFPLFSPVALKTRQGTASDCTTIASFPIFPHSFPTIRHHTVWATDSGIAYTINK
jgi:hypothetical protein